MTKNAGFSLIEVLIAFVIMMSVLAVLLPSNATLFSAIPHAEERVLALDYAQSRIAAIGVSGEIVVGEAEGRYREKWIWQEVITQRSETLSDRGLFEITITILSPNKNELAQVSVLRMQK